MRHYIRALAVLAACMASPLAAQSTSRIAVAKRAVLGLLADPRSALFRSAHVVSDSVVCGVVSARNQFDGMEMKAFVYVGKATRDAFLTDGSDLASRQLFRVLCGYRVSEPPESIRRDWALVRPSLITAHARKVCDWRSDSLSSARRVAATDAARARIAVFDDMECMASAAVTASHLYEEEPPR